MAGKISDNVQELLDVSDSQLDKQQLKESSFNNLMNFLNTYIEKASTQTELKKEVERKLLSKLIEDEDPSYGVLIKLIEVLNRQETDAALPLLQIMANAAKKEDGLLQNANMDPNEKFTVNEMQKTKRLLELIDHLEQTEFDKKDKENK